MAYLRCFHLIIPFSPLFLYVVLHFVAICRLHRFYVAFFVAPRCWCGCGFHSSSSHPSRSSTTSCPYICPSACSSRSISPIDPPQALRYQADLIDTCDESGLPVPPAIGSRGTCPNGRGTQHHVKACGHVQRAPDPNHADPHHTVCTRYMALQPY